jgi:hypothetical protein
VHVLLKKPKPMSAPKQTSSAPKLLPTPLQPSRNNLPKNV